MTHVTVSEEVIMEERPVGGLSPESAVEAMMADVWIMAYDNVNHEYKVYKMSHYGQIWCSEFSQYTGYHRYSWTLTFADIESFIETMHAQKNVTLSLNPEYMDKFQKCNYLDELIKHAEKNIVGVDNEVNRHYQAMLNSINRQKQLVKWFVSILKSRTTKTNATVVMNKELMGVLNRGRQQVKSPEEV